MLSAMIQEDERGLGGWQAEWETLPEIVTLTAGALHHLTAVAPKLEIDAARMRENLDLTRGLVFAEAATAALGEKIGRSQARALLDALTAQAAKEKRSLREVLAEHPEAKKHLSSAELDKLFDVRAFAAMTNQFIDRVVEKYKQRKD
jgi:3-carboxy-cis,cis-muconate cycloisomerase